MSSSNCQVSVRQRTSSTWIFKSSPGGLSATTKPPPSMSKPRLAARGNPGLVTYDEIPAWYQDNDYILEGYRPVSGSASLSFASWLYIHNETVNIYTHLLPAVAFLLGVWYVVDYLHSNYADVTAVDELIFVFFLLTATACLGLSTTYHTLINHSFAVETFWLRLDFIGIVVLTLGSFVSGIYVSFWCEAAQRNIYWAMISMLGSLTIFLLVSPKFQGRRWRTLRTCTFVATGLSGFAPLVHGVTLFGLPQMLRQSGMPYYLTEGALYILGVTVYATRFPECLSPGRFDIYGSSHQIFHVLVVAATIVHFAGVLAAYDYNYHNRMCS
ncbi:mPR-like GPCR protein [Coniochaeta ligniaria NRRL 30616]|uniref:MPR-like GPCR protein n=1 Tax=Coniochaeta ligniaria NRRL 30616 TaxID=1408157 RepID=A0A1J7I864_9PEZI|nr:mPR-like GPCR protein [Coniochaeta ligniaria NRRL 30616]